MATIKVRLLTNEQAEQLRGQLWAEDSYFEPQTDLYGRYVLSEREAANNENTAFAWVSDLPVIDFVPPPVVIDF